MQLKVDLRYTMNVQLWIWGGDPGVHLHPFSRLIFVTITTVILLTTRCTCCILLLYM